MWTRKKPFLNNQGFTLLEVLIAIMIMAMALGSIIAIQGGAIVATARAKQMNIVAMLARNQMIETEFKFRGKTFEEMKKEDGGTFDPPYQDYTWKSVAKEIQFPQLSALSPQKSEGKGGGGTSEIQELVTKLTTNFLSKAMREVTVSVLWKQSGKEQSFSLTTYWVNLNHEFSLNDQ
ncbi:MAG: prepilin-type N-terminal cleavage/methylation domain-containing protein [Bdellovibrio sp.]|nr:prepilin-type N-terminal cleavage/methylation domain-containing protein [Bdellovibrio sp.]